MKIKEMMLIAVLGNKNHLRAICCTAASAILVLVGSQSAQAFSSANTTTLFNNFNNAFYVGNPGYYKQYKSGGDTGFWQQAETIEMVEDANNGAMVSALLSGFSSQRGSSWSGNSFNDDICWACLAYLRGYQLTGNSSFLNTAKSNFDMMYARAWDNSAGGLFWTTANNSKNSCVEGPGSMVAYLIYQANGDSSYLTKAQNITNYQRAHLWNSSTGQIYDNLGSQAPTTYNQGTFITANDNLGWTGGATLACNYLKGMGSIMPNYGSGNNNSGFNGIAIRAAAKYMNHRGMQGSYLSWLQTNAQGAWNVVRPSDGLSWQNWSSALQNGTYVGSWDCVSSVVALEVVPPTQ